MAGASQRLLVIPFAKSINIKKKYKKVLIHRQDAKQIDFPWLKEIWFTLRKFYPEHVL